MINWHQGDIHSCNILLAGRNFAFSYTDSSKEVSPSSKMRFSTCLLPRACFPCYIIRAIFSSLYAHTPPSAQQPNGDAKARSPSSLPLLLLLLLGSYPLSSSNFWATACQPYPERCLNSSIHRHSIPTKPASGNKITPGPWS